MHTFKRIVSYFLLCSMIFGLLPATVFAEQPASQASVGDRGISISGQGSFARLLSQELNAQRSGENAGQYPYGYGVSSLTFEGSTATVEFEAAEDALLLAAIYTDDGNQLLGMVSTAVSAGDTQVQVTFPGEMPAYFYAAAYLVNPSDYVPLCDQYYTPMYTRQMQELLQSTVDDYSDSLVWNLDEDEKTNFAVFHYTVRRLEYRENVNTLVSADEETKTYVFENCDSKLLYLVKGSVIAYMWQGQPLIIKVASYEKSGKTVTITGGEIEMSDVFQYIKIEGSGDTSDVIVQEDPDSPVQYVPQAQVFSARTSDEPLEGTEDFVDKTLNFTVGKPDDEDSDDPVDFGITGNLALTLNGYVDYYLAESYQFLDVCLDYSAALSLSFQMGKEFTVPTLPMELPLVVGIVTVTFQPEVVVECSLSATISGTISGNVAFLYDSIRGGTDHSSDPKFKTSLKLEGTVKAGINWKAGLKIGGMHNLYVLHGTIGLFTGVELTVTATSPINETDLSGNPQIIHGCQTCIAGDFKPVFSLELELKFLGGWLKVSLEVLSWDLPSILTFYMSCENGKWDFGLGSCPNQAQRVIVQVNEHDNTPAKNATVVVTGTARQFGQEAQEQPGTASWTQEYTTDENGIAYIYLYSGSYLFTALDMMVGKQIGEPCRVMIHRDEAVALDILIEGGLDPATILDPGVVAFGNAGAEGYQLSWVLYGSGELHIQGEGPMYEEWSVPWSSYRQHIRTVIIHEGVTTVGNSAFSGCDRLVAVSIADSVEHIGESAFHGCDNLRKIQLPQNLKTLGGRVFYGCKLLPEITLPESLTAFGEHCFYQCENLEKMNIPKGITELPEGVFRECKALRTIVIPEAVTAIGETAFYECTGLRSIVVPKGVTQIGEWTFGYCTALEAVILPEGLLSIGDNAFYGDELLMSVNIPSTVLTLGRECFAHCGKLQSVILPQGLTAIPPKCFYECASLINTKIPENVTVIGSKAFSGCGNITEVILPEGVETIEQGAFAYCENLSTVSLPGTLTYIGGGTTLLEVFPTGAFAGCDNLTSIVIPGSVEVLGYYTFQYCENLSSVVIGEGVRVIQDAAFDYCESLTAITIPASVTEFGGQVFSECVNLHSIRFLGSNPGIDNDTFKCMTPECSLNAYYPAGDGSWVTSELPDQRGLFMAKSITWTAGGTSAISEGTDLAEPASRENSETHIRREEPVLYAAPEVDFETEFTEEGTLKTAFFTGLIPGASYLVVNVVSLEGELLAPENLLAIRQCVAGADGTLRLQYFQRVPTDNTYMLAFGIGNRDVGDASVQVEACIPDGSLQQPGILVTMDGRTLREGTDYVLIGDTQFLLPGNYRATIRGIGSFYGKQEVTFTVSEEAECPFTDVPKGTYYYEPVVWAVKEGITTGKTETTFEPDEPCTRKQIVTFLWRAAGEPEPRSMVNPFTDVKNDRFTKAILWAYYEGITSGTGDGTTFSPENPCTRKQIVTFLWRFNGQPKPTSTKIPFTDVKNDRFTDAILWAYQESITTGTGDGSTFSPEDTCNRKQIVTFLYRSTVE